jgi:hypothetical protein
MFCCLLIFGVIFVDTDNISWSLFPIGGHVVVKRYRNAKIFFGGDFNLGDINWATGGTYLKVTS